MKIEIDTTKNGYIIDIKDIEETFVFQELEIDDDHEAAHECFMRMANFLMDELGVCYSKHKKNNCIIKMEENDK